MRLSVTVELFLSPEVISRENIDKNQAMGLVGSAIESALHNLGELVHFSAIETQVTKEGPNAAN